MSCDVVGSTGCELPYLDAGNSKHSLTMQRRCGRKRHRFEARQAAARAAGRPIPVAPHKMRRSCSQPVAEQHDRHTSWQSHSRSAASTSHESLRPHKSGPLRTGQRTRTAPREPPPVASAQECAIPHRSADASGLSPAGGPGRSVRCGGWESGSPRRSGHHDGGPGRGRARRHCVGHTHRGTRRLALRVTRVTRTAVRGSTGSV
jgi:hypothetical protein